ncbi:hypothetical protein [Paenibacillus soyae]|uniref:Uncharacterized protein n=1 Tax=Paenibacillus soyae TaxID=2969249 RepID=A0A9X2MW68_9BACL|nr:hypothetical protein [Paenibacillus soyae]MCR2807999.1 hypothetical protein [Paenibacillus soyae]
MNLKKLSITDRAIFILGLTLAGVITFVLVAGVALALLKMYLDLRQKNGKGRAVMIRSEATRSDAAASDPEDSPSSDERVLLDSPEQDDSR